MLYGLDIQNRKICQIHSNSFCPSRLKYHRICDREFFSQNIHSFSSILKFLPPENLSTCMVASDCLLPSSWWKHVVYAIATNHKMNCWLDNFVFYDKLCEKKQFWWFRKSCFLSNCHKLDGKSHSFQHWPRRFQHFQRHSSLPPALPLEGSLGLSLEMSRCPNGFLKRIWKRCQKTWVSKMIIRLNMSFFACHSVLFSLFDSPWWISISKCDSHSTLARSSDARPKMRCTPGHWVYNYPNCHWGFTHWSWFGKKSPSNMDSFGHDTDGSRWLSLAPGVPAPCGQRRQAWRMQIQCVFFYFVNLY